MLTNALARFPRLQLIPQATALQHLPRLSQHLGRDIWIKRDDLTPLALGGNKARKLEYLAADAQAKGADVLVTAGAIQSNHVRQTAAVAAQLGLGCLALLENPIDSQSDDYLGNGNRLLLDLFGAEVENVANLDNADQLLEAACRRPSTYAFRVNRITANSRTPAKVTSEETATTGSSAGLPVSIRKSAGAMTRMPSV